MVLVGPRSFETPRRFAIGPRDVVVAVDGGWNQARRRGWTVQLAVGDWDSVRGSRPGPNVPSVTFSRDKSASDAALALKEVRKRFTFDRFIALGFSGGRRDHELAFWMDVCAWVRPREQVQLEGAWALGPGVHRLPCRGTFSVFSFRGAQGVSVRGARYGARRFDLRPGSLGLSNVALRSGVEVSVRRGRLLVIGSDRNGGVASAQSKSR